MCHIICNYNLFADDEDAQQPLAFDDEENEVPVTVFSGFKDKTKG